MKIVSKTLLTISTLLIISVLYLSIFGIETDKFNDQISNKIKNIHKELDVELKKIELVLDPFGLKLNIKTIGSTLKNRNQKIEIENIKTQISLKSLIENKFSIENLEISTKSLEIKSLISFIRSFQNTPELFVLERIVKKGFLIADVKLEFNQEGKIKDNYEINGFIRDTKFSIFKKYDIQKLNLIFEYKKDNLSLSDVALSLNNLDLLSKNISLKKIKENYLIKGNINHGKLEIEENNLNLFIRPFLKGIDLKKLKLSSNNDFTFKVNKKFQLNDLVFNSKILIDEFSIINKFKIKNFLPNIKDSFIFSNHELLIKYTKDNLYINGAGDILTQNKNDILTYSINKKKDILDFKTSLKVNKNPLKIDFLNYEKNQALIQLEGFKNKKDEIFIKHFSIDGKKNEINLKNFTLNKKFEIMGLGEFNLDYIDKENQKNQIKLYAIKDQFILDGPFFNANKLIDDLLFNNKNSNYFNFDKRIKIKIDKILFDNENNLFDLNGNILFKNKEILKANLDGNFSNNKKLKFTVNTSNNNKITTLYVDKAEPIVKRYKFIKGFDEGQLDFYSLKSFDESFSKIKIYDFKLKELPLLTKILTLASLQGIADILSGEGIRFDEFEMKFQNKGNLMTIDEIYAIGPAISILIGVSLISKLVLKLYF